MLSNSIAPSLVQGRNRVQGTVCFYLEEPRFENKPQAIFISYGISQHYNMRAVDEVLVGFLRTKAIEDSAQRCEIYSIIYRSCKLLDGLFTDK